MKRKLLSILGLAAVATLPAFGQGFIVMENYQLLNGVTPVYSAVRSHFPGHPLDHYLGAHCMAELLYYIGTTPNPWPLFQVAAGSQTHFFTGSVDGGTPTTDGAGTFIGPSVTIPGYSSGPVTFVVRAWTGSTWGDPSGISGYSATFVIPSLQTNPLLAADDLLNIVGGVPTGLQPFWLLPEPSTAALMVMAAAGSAFSRKRKLTHSGQAPE